MKTEWRHVLEIGNGLWTIVSGYLVVFLAYHLTVITVQRKLWMKSWINLPLSVQLAVGTWVASIGVLMTRIVVFLSRATNDGYLAFDDDQTVVFIAGIFVGLGGFLCILRVSTKPMLGHWPWVSCLVCCAFYLLLATVLRA